MNLLKKKSCVLSFLYAKSIVDMLRILLVEDDLLLGDGIKTCLHQFGYTVDWTHDGQSALMTLSQEHYDIMLLDLNIPKKDGHEVLSIIRSKKISIPVIVLTAKDDITNKLKALDSGADDYIVKPVDPMELKSRINAVQRRFHSQNSSQIEFGSITMDTSTHNLEINGKSITLSKKEFKILHKLMQQPNKVIKRDILIQTLYGWEEDVESNTLEVHIYNIRKKLGNDVKLVTIRGVGYMLKES